MDNVVSYYILQNMKYELHSQVIDGEADFGCVLERPVMRISFAQRYAYCSISGARMNTVLDIFSIRMPRSHERDR